MRTVVTLAAVATLSLPLAGCSSDAPTRSTTAAEPELAQAKTAGGTSTPVAESRVATPLPEAGDRANYPEGFEVGRTRPVDQPGNTFDTGAEPGDSVMEQEPSLAEAGAATADPAPTACLAALGNLRIDVTDVYDGAAIIVTSRSGDSAEIFERASTLAQAQSLASQREDDGTATAKPGEQPAAALDMPPADVRVVELAHGARIHYLARDTDDDVTELRNAVRRVASAMERGVCPGL